MKVTAEARSDQWNAEDFIGSDRVFTVEKVTEGKATQPFDIYLAGESKVWRPPKTVRALLIAAWGDESDVWTGRQVQLYYDPEVVYGGKKVGGVRVRAMSHIERPVRMMLQKRRGEKVEHVIDVLKPQSAPTPAVTDEQIVNAATVEELRSLWAGADEMQQTAIKARVAALTAPTDEPEGDAS